MPELESAPTTLLQRAQERIQRLGLVFQFQFQPGGFKSAQPTYQRAEVDGIFFCCDEALRRRPGFGSQKAVDIALGIAMMVRKRDCVRQFHAQLFQAGEKLVRPGYSTKRDNPFHGHDEKNVPPDSPRRESRWNQSRNRWKHDYVRP